MWYSWFIMIQPISVLPHLLNWIIFWIEFFWNFLNWIIFWIEFLWKILNWIIFWIEFSWNTIELNIELNHFLAKFNYWIESIWVSLTPKLRWMLWLELSETLAGSLTGQMLCCWWGRIRLVKYWGSFSPKPNHKQPFLDNALFMASFCYRCIEKSCLGNFWRIHERVFKRLILIEGLLHHEWRKPCRS